MKRIRNTGIALTLAMFAGIIAASVSDFNQASGFRQESSSVSAAQTTTMDHFVKAEPSDNDKKTINEPESFELPVVRLLTENKITGYVCERLITLLFGSSSK